MTKQNEDTRVKIPTILHLTRLGYKYLSLKQATWCTDTDIFPDIFKESIERINPGMDGGDVERCLDDLKLSLDNEDLGRVFYEKLTSRSGIKLIDFDDFSKNRLHVVTELTYKNGDEEFRPDITLLINGMPLVFIEVKKPNNKDGVIAERNRINTRFQNPKFRRFVNITQLMLFSNNMEYDDGSSEPIQGAFYASSSYTKPIFNYFREEEVLNLTKLINPLTDETENFVLKDNNYTVIKHSPEFITNKDHDAPTNRICTSLLNPERLAFMLRYSLAYVKETDGLQKHVMRYPQLFATKAIENKLSEGIKKGIIWHTQGSGKTALAYYNVRHLTDYYQKQHIIPKFYFIVDRIDLLVQAQREFTSRGLMVHTVNSREAFAQSIKATKVIHNDSGKPEITVVNIQKFEDDPSVVRTVDYDVNIQRVYFLDEVHRSYNPKGSFLANLTQSDPNAIKIGLTGTPLLLEEKDKDPTKESKAFSSKQIFGNYIHKYYYNASIADGYTLRLIREEIASNYVMAMREALQEIELQQGSIDKKEAYAHSKFVEPMLNYIVQDFEKSRSTWGDNSIGGMVICDSSEQAKELFKQFNAIYATKPILPASSKSEEDVVKESAINEPKASYNKKLKRDSQVQSAALILHDVGSKDERKDWVEKFKAGEIDFVFVYNMLLTGFDAKRLKKLYLGRVIKKHNLLQALTRVNRTYKEFRYGYVVDFADISAEFDATNKAYFDELKGELGDEMDSYSNLFKSHEEVQEEIEHIKDVLFQFDTENAELFQQQISQISDRKQILVLKKALESAKDLYNLIRLQGDAEQLQELDFAKLNVLYRYTNDHLGNLNLKLQIENSTDTTNLLNAALEDVVFMFTKVGESELKLADELKNTLRKTREALAGNIDQADPKFIALKEELERLFKTKNLSEVSQEQMDKNIGALRKIHERVKVLNQENNRYKAKYLGDEKYARTHKRLLEARRGEGLHSKLFESTENLVERRIFDALAAIKQLTDEQVLNNQQLLNNESYFERTVMPNTIKQFKMEQRINLTPVAAKHINMLVVREYLNEFNGRAPW
ncbi:restriction endonuclease subunit R [Vibrio breoganii]|uniref:type I restriction endonuclease subunit R n=3 Tax=Vibrio breoganii TaxID=553239 RepID=UPI000C82B561|nr:type I restriction endonuclease [Vibrio breoganii]PMG38602.1 restriction endonuclease subunit R [Vibrio breoganii]PML23437.1 restriction endonuclease subunit R [Vibrio breoganii]PML80265.1 restriction endonuclease subunit R [Vibrio breoganii]PMO99797.1 restriction endonuclease subunit R [Vibrio breoganii]